LILRAPDSSDTQTKEESHESRTSHQSLPGIPQSEFKKNTIDAYRDTLSKFCDEFGRRELESLSSEEVLSFLTSITEGTKQSTKHTRYSHVKAFFNFIKEAINHSLQNPCDAPMIKKLFRPAKAHHWDTLQKEVVDEIIFRTTNPRNRLMLELMARGGMRVGEVLNLTPRDIQGRKLLIGNPKSGKEAEVVFVPRKIANRLKEYVREKGIEPDQRIFPITYAAARLVVKKAGELVGIRLRPHDLRRHCATYASRARTPIEIVSKIILRHSNLSTTQMYLGRVSDAEAIRWIENLYD
jgi:integrase